MKSGIVGKLFLALASTVVGFSVIAAAGEYAVRHRERTRATVPGTMPLLFYRHSRYGHALVRNADYFGWVHTDSLGFRGKQVSIEKRPGTIRIVAMGGSTTFDTFVSADDRTWPARTEYWLRRLAPGTPVEVINAGVPGYRIADDFLRLRDIAQLEPDVIIQLHGHNDLISTLGSVRYSDEWTPRPGEVRQPNAVVRWLEGNSLLYAKVIGRVQAVSFRRSQPSKARVFGWYAVIANGANRFERELNAFVLTAQMMKARVFLSEVVHVSGEKATESDSAIFRSWRNAVPMTVPDTVLYAYAQFNEAVRRTAAARSATLLPSLSWSLTGRENYVEDDPIHFNDVGADLMGRHVAEALIKSGVLLTTTAAATH